MQVTGPNDSNMVWDTRENCCFINKSYQVSSLNTGYMGECIAIGTNFDNFAYQITMVITRGDCGGIEFRRTDDANFDLYEICQNGTFFAAVVHNNISYPKPAFSTSLALHQGLNQVNTIAVVVQDTTVNLYANGQQIGVLTDNTETHGQIGLFASDRQNATIATCTDAIVWTIPPPR